MASAASSGLGLLGRALQSFMDDSCPRLAAALSYYTIFSLPPLLVLVTMLVAPVLDPTTVQDMLQGQIGQVVGPEGAQQIAEMVQNVKRPGTGGIAAAVLGLAAFLFGATGAFAQLQDALNAAWGVEPDPARGGVKNFLLKRVFSFAIILGIGFLLLVSLVVSAVLAAFQGLLEQLLPPGFSVPLLQTINNGVSFAVVALLFAALFKVVPDAVIRWRDIAVGAVATALLFVIGKFAIGLYLGRSDPASVYGAAGSFALVLVWIYYTSMILLFGAEFTRAWAAHRGAPIRPQPGAVRVVRSREPGAAQVRSATSA